ncbi:MAG TPA: Na+/H+ antiporter subunit E [Candidatus Hydrogenedens sp.]|nr:Na+/H+ antiporter subunit E [Candidatus Hydrogenedens sp.]HOK08490.1 Na+/H+ antiporter subunit E [Candidatus Hydrogenedens sp.]HOL20346.1 Na+/H+ antiporter subunit E [Candidatus Hydrogenedens sp.]HPP57840.1 Na+/H+ antiporter subunit E [Candidatus Hydrogenedens sp.]
MNANLFLANILLSLIWAFISGVLTFANILLGFIIGYAILYVLYGKEVEYFKKILFIILFTFRFIWLLILSNIEVAYEVLRFKPKAKPGIIAYPLNSTHPLEITLLANFISLTPGTLSVDISENDKVLYIHALFAHNPDTLKRDIEKQLEKPLNKIFR